MPEKEPKILTLCEKGQCCPKVFMDGNKIKFKFDDNTNTMTIEQFRILLERGREILP